MSPIGNSEVWQGALARWGEIARNSPDLQPALDLQQHILRILLDASEALNGQGGEVSSLPSDAVLGKWIRGVPALRNTVIAVPSPLTEILPALCRTLVDGGAGDAAAHIGDALANGAIDAESLFRVSLARNETAIRTSALHMGLSPDLVWLIGELASSPLAHHLQTQLLNRADLREPLSQWDRGYCPCCGSWPVFIEVVSGSQYLRCSFCAASWQLSSRRCIYCGNAGSTLVTAAPDASRTQRRVDLCGQCGHYTKVIDTSAPTPFPLLAIEDLASIDLDRGAMTRKYDRPTLFDLEAIEPLSSRSGGCA